MGCPSLPSSIHRGGFPVAEGLVLLRVENLVHILIKRSDPCRIIPVQFHMYL